MQQKISKVIAKILNPILSRLGSVKGLSAKVADIKERAYKNWLKFSFFMTIAVIITMLIVNTAYFFIERSSNTRHGIDSGQIALINLESDAVVVGKVIFDQLAEEEKKKVISEIEDKFNVDKMEEEALTAKDKMFKAKVSEEDMKKSKVVLIVRDLGLSKSLTLDTLDMENNLTLGFTPYSVDIQNWVEQAVNKGFEVLVNIPMQPTDYPVNDPGPYAMINNLSKGENISRFNWISTRSEKIVGFYTNENETFTNSKTNFMPILERVKEDGRYMIFGNLTNKNATQSISESIDVKITPVFNIIDTVLEEEKIKNKLLLLEAEAMRRGFAIGYLNPYPISLRMVKQWMSEIDRSKLAVVPISAIFPEEEKKEKPMGIYDITRQILGSNDESESKKDIANEEESQKSETKEEQ